METYRVRDVGPDDVAAMAAWLPPDADRSPPAAAPGEWWLAAVPAQSDVPVAALRLRSSIGLDRPRFWYRIGCRVHAAPELRLFHRQTTLLLGNDHTGAAELADLAVDARRLGPDDARHAQSALQAVALRRLAAEVESGRCSADTVIAELPGMLDGQGRSPFWHGLGRHFYGEDVTAAAARVGGAWRTHVAALMPRQPVYASMLSPDAQAAIGQADAACAPIAEALREQGFRPGRQVRIDDAGPVMERALR